MMNKLLFFILILWLGFSIFAGSPVTVAHNTLKEINACMGKVILTPVRTWGGDDEQDEHKFFKYPWDLIADKNGLIYICVYGAHQIQVFDGTGKYIRTIGRQGNGPTDLLNPNGLSWNLQGNIVVSDSSNRRIQFLTPEGKYAGGFKCNKTLIQKMYYAHRSDEILIYSFNHTFSSGKLIDVYDKKGNLIRSIGKYVSDKKDFEKAEHVNFVLDENDNIYTSYSGTPYLLVFSYAGNIKTLITYETPFESRRVFMDQSGKGIEIQGNKLIRSTYGLAVDTAERIFIVCATRNLTEKEKKESLSGSIAGKGKAVELYVPPVEDEHTDMYKLIVFNPSGKVIAAAQLNNYCDKIVVHKDRLFIIDTMKSNAIYEYKMTFK